MRFNKNAPVAGLISLMLATSGCGSHATSSIMTDVPFVGVDTANASAADKTIAGAQTRLRANGNDDDARATLATAFLQKARENADPTLYSKADGLLKDLLKRHPDDLTVLTASGSLALSQHRFQDALDIGHKVLKGAQDNETALGIVIDAENELGRYDEALRDTETMVAFRPNLPSLSRASYARELRGDIPGAISAMSQAVIAGGSGGGENVAYLQVQLGDLLLKNHQVDAADEQYAQAEKSFPGFAAALAGHANVAVARNKTADAIPLWDRVLKIQPLPAYAQTQGDALAAVGRQAEADRSYALVDIIFKLQEANGVKADFEEALFRSDHGADKSTVTLARRALKMRATTLSHDALAWNLYRTGNKKGASKEMTKALALGTNDPQIRFHAAQIADANNKADAARDNLTRVVRGNPRFSAAYASQVEALASKLGIPA